METVIDKKKNRLFIILSGIFLTNAIVAEMIGVKIFSGEATLGLQPAHINLLGFTLDFNLTAGAIIWPFVFITTDIINEYFGKDGVKRISVLTACLIAYAFLIIAATTLLPPADFWLNLNNTDDQGHAFNINYAFKAIFRQGLKIIIASLTAFLIGQFLDVYVFHKLRTVTGNKMIWLRATGSTLVSQFIDSFVVLFIAFYFFGNWSFDQIISVGIMNYIYKFCVAILLTPLIYLGHSIIDNYLGKENAKKIIDDAAAKSNTLF